MKPKILLIEDDTELATLTQDYLQKNDMTVVIEADGQYAVERIINEQADCVLLDIMLPNKDGFAICRGVRDRYHNPILMLTARDEDRISCLVWSRVRVIMFANQFIRVFYWHVFMRYCVV
jgi:DNA-binding response OmpR family regulator